MGFPFFREDVALSNSQAAAMPVHAAANLAGGNMKRIRHRIDCAKACRELDPDIFLQQEVDGNKLNRVACEK